VKKFSQYSIRKKLFRLAFFSVTKGVKPAGSNRQVGVAQAGSFTLKSPPIRSNTCLVIEIWALFHVFLTARLSLLPGWLSASQQSPWPGVTCRADESALRPGSRVAIIGDSITEQKLYSKYIEAYLLACSGVPDVKVFQFGWGGETASGFSARAENDLAGFQPTLATLCYGMNDGGYQPYQSAIGDRYEANMRSVLKKLEAAGVKSVVIGSPGAVDTKFFRNGQMMGSQPAYVAYNDNLAHLRDIDRKLSLEHKQLFADVHGAMVDAMTKAKATLGEDYDVCGRDGFHPGPNGHLIMAYAFLKGLALDGAIGQISVNLKGESSASEGHRIVTKGDGKLELESTRWPFCFQGDAKSSGGTRSITPFSPFNSDLNRLLLRVQGLETPAAKVTWGGKDKQFTREQLAAGVNLAAEFDSTPFDAPFEGLLGAIGNKQNFETFMIKSLITQFRSLPPDLKDDAELQAALGVVRKRLMAKHEQYDAAVRAALKPVKHSLEITPTAE
jgi:lysophospholipase L1-like esterase